MITANLASRRGPGTYDAQVRVWGADGDRYRVKRRWLPWRQRRRVVDRSNLDLVGVDGDDFVAVLVVVLAILLFPIILVAAIAVGELLLLFLLFLLLPFWMLARSVFGTPWIVEVHRFGHGMVHQEAVRGWGESQRRIEQLAREVTAGGFQRAGGPLSR
ncbi:hypothetical protein GCM10027517_05830 [Phycicoccus ginsengisoli]